MDDNLTRLESRATLSAKRYGRIALIVVGAAITAGAGFLIYRRMRRPTLRDRLHDLSLDELRFLAGELSEKLRERLPSVTLRVNEKTDPERGTVESILRKVAPGLVGTAGSALLERVVGARDGTYGQPQAE